MAKTLINARTLTGAAIGAGLAWAFGSKLDKRISGYTGAGVGAALGLGLAYFSETDAAPSTSGVESGRVTIGKIAKTPETEAAEAAKRVATQRAKSERLTARASSAAASAEHAASRSKDAEAHAAAAELRHRKELDRAAYLRDQARQLDPGDDESDMLRTAPVSAPRVLQLPSSTITGDDSDFEDLDSEDAQVPARHTRVTALGTAVGRFVDSGFSQY